MNINTTYGTGITSQNAGNKVPNSTNNETSIKKDVSTNTSSIQHPGQVLDTSKLDAIKLRMQQGSEDFSPSRVADKILISEGIQ